MGSSRIGVPPFSEWCFHSVTLPWTGPWTWPRWAAAHAPEEASSAWKHRCIWDIQEECSFELLVSRKIRSPRALGGIKGLRREWSMGRLLPSHVYPCVLTAVLTPVSCAMQTICCVTSIKNAFSILSPLWNIAHQTIVGLGKTQMVKD